MSHPLGILVLVATTREVGPSPNESSDTVRTQRNTDRRARTLHLVDIENLIGADPKTASIHDVHHAFGQFALAARQRVADLMIIGCNPKLAVKVQATLRGSGRIRTRKGPDGADLALLDAVEVDLWSKRFDRVVIGSGDHIFTETAARLREAGLEVVVVGLDGHTSIDLRSTASAFRPIRTPQSSTRCINLWSAA